jgi:hypothetical protein
MTKLFPSVNLCIRKQKLIKCHVINNTKTLQAGGLNFFMDSIQRAIPDTDINMQEQMLQIKNSGQFL